MAGSETDLVIGTATLVCEWATLAGWATLAKRGGTTWRALPEAVLWTWT